MKKFMSLCCSCCIAVLMLLYGPSLACSAKTTPDATQPTQINKKPKKPQNITYRVIGKKEEPKEVPNE